MGQKEQLENMGGFSAQTAEKKVSVLPERSPWEERGVARASEQIGAVFCGWQNLWRAFRSVQEPGL